MSGNQKAASVELHAHSYFSFLDGIVSPERLISAAAERGYGALALTDHGGLFGAVRFLEAARASGVKPILGCELYVAPTRHGDFSPGQKPVGYHLTVLATNRQGWDNLARLSSIGYTDGFHFRPRVDLNLLELHATGLIALTGCYHGALLMNLRAGRPDDARRWLTSYADIFGKENCYVEIQRHGLEEEPAFEPDLRALAKSAGLACVATNDVHYIDPEDSDAQLAAMNIRSQKQPGDPRRIRFQNPTYHLLAADEWQNLFADDPASLKNQRKIADHCDVIDLRAKPPSAQRTRAAAEWLSARLAEAVVGDPRLDAVRADAEKEIETLAELNMAPFVQTVAEFTAHARHPGGLNIPVGPGRGSAVASRLLYALGVTQVDPSAYGLRFDRFISAARAQVPDIDIDVGHRRRDELVSAFRDKREGRAAIACTFSVLGLKSAIREVGRLKDIPYQEVDRLIRETAAGADRLVPSDAFGERLAPVVNRLVGVPMKPVAHPSAVAPLPDELVLPERERALSGVACLQWDSADLEYLGIPCIDFLPSRYLTLLRDVEEQLTAEGVSLDLARIPDSDARTWELLARGNTAGLFQVDQPGMRALLMEVSPSSILELAIVLALYRPGPLEAGLNRRYLEARKYYSDQGRSRAEYPVALEPHLRETYGLVLFQEQIMGVAQAAGLSAAEADRYRVALAKGHAADAESLGARLPAGLIAAGVSEARAQRLALDLAQVGGMAFNKAHAVAYATLVYRGAYMKAHEPARFMAAAINSADRSHDRALLFTELKREGLDVLPPDVQSGRVRSRAEGERAVRVGLGCIRHLPEELVQEIEAKRPFDDVTDLLVKVPGLLERSKALEALIKSGALAAFEPSRGILLARMERLRRDANLASTGGAQSGLFEEDADDPAALMSQDDPMWEKEAFGFFVTSRPLDDYRHIVSAFCDAPLAKIVAQVEQSGEPAEVTTAGILTRVRTHQDKGGRDMAFAQLEDDGGSCDMVLFHDVYLASSKSLIEGKAALVRGRVERRGVAVSLIADLVVDMDHADRLFDSIFVKIREGVKLTTIDAVKSVLSGHPGDRPVVMEVVDGGRPYRIRLKQACRPAPLLRDQIESILGPHSVIYVKRKLQGGREQRKYWKAKK